MANSYGVEEQGDGTLNEVSPVLMDSFSNHRGLRGVHFYDSSSCEFLSWDETMSAIHETFPESFYDKLIEAVANYDPETEFVTVSAGGGQLTIELFKAVEM